MSGDAPVDPAEVPVFTGDLGVLDEKVKALSTGGVTVSSKATDVHTSFGGLSAFYQAPEADQLFATTKPVSDVGLTVSSDMCTIVGALGTYSRDAEPLVKKLENLKTEAAEFRTKVADDDKWREDGDLIEENLNRRNEIAEVWAQFQEVERAAYAKIVALVGGKALKVNDGSNGEGMYGYDAEALKQSKSLPWGDAVEESVPAWQVWEHAWDFGKGLIVDGVWGTLKGLGGLVGLSGWDTFKASWTGLGKLATGLAISSIPGVRELYWAAPDDKLPSWLRDSRTAMKETGKALLAWDQWGSNPSRAAGAVTFNVLTTVFTGGSGGAVSGAGKAGAVAKALSFAGKAGRAIDPMTYIFKGAGAGVSKIGDVLAGLKGMGKIEIPKIDVDGAFALPDGGRLLPDGTIEVPPGTAIPEGATKLPDGTIKVPEGTATLPPGTVKLPVDGPPQFMDPKGNIYDAKGAITQHADEAPPGKPGTGAGVPKADSPTVDSPTTAKVPDRELVGVGGRGDDVIRVGSDISDPVRAGDDLPGGRPDTTPGGTAGHTPGGHAGDHMPTNRLDNPPRGGHADTPGTGGHADSPGTAGHADGPGGTPHTDGPGSGGGGHHEPPAPGGAHPGGVGGADDAARGADDAAHRAEYEAAREKPASERTPAERAAISREHVRLADENLAWRMEHYDKIGRRLDSTKMVDGQLLPQLVEKPGGGWMAADDIPYADPEKYRPGTMHRGPSTVTPDNVQHLNETAAKRHAGMGLTKAETKFEADPSSKHAQELAAAQKHYDDTVGADVPNNSKLGEALGEEAARRHMLQQPEFQGAKEIIDLPETPNGAKRFDQLWRTKEGNLLIVEAKGPKGDLEWRRGNGDLDQGMKVKQGTIEYVRTIVADMQDRAWLSPDDGKYAAEIQAAIDNKTLEYVLVQATENSGTYAGAELKYFKIF
ncbi:hypothetical protein [Streptomyces sp. NPDC021212]|uniref:hypothetical protein n=1 Tax=Streptomyces sp. NPDC021212 TaxID=3365118 RepID=UPI00379CE800